MDLLWKKAALPSIEDFAKDLIIKKNLTTELRRSIRALQEGNLENPDIPDSDERANALCYVLEAVFIHGLKDKISAKVSSVFGSNSEKIPEPQFWSVVAKYCHKNVILEVNNFNQITTDIGRCRAWLRVALNDGLIVSYIGTMLNDKGSLQKYYSSSAYMLDEEQSDIMKQLLEGTSVFHFEFSCNNSSLNVWNNLPLTLANLWTPPITPQPVMPAVEVIDFFTEQKTQAEVYIKTEALKHKADRSSVATQSDATGEASSSESKDTSESGRHHEITETLAEPHDISSPNGAVSTPPMTELTQSNETNNVSDYTKLPTMQPNVHQHDETCSKISSSDSVPDFVREISDDSPDHSTRTGSLGNKLNEKCGWSSEFEQDREQKEADIDQSYDSLLQSYNKNLSKVVIGTPELAETFSSIMGKSDEDESEDFSSSTKSPDFDFEIVPKYLTTEGADVETKRMLSIIDKICPEQGLDSQNFKCCACGRPVGMIYGKARVCNFDGYNYCYDCHENDEFYIPARMVHSWDFKQYPVSKRSHAFLLRMVKDPILDIKIINPCLYNAVEEMAQMQLLRTQLTFLRSYIFTCKESIVEELRTRLWPREYLFEHVHLYAIDDLLEIPNGTLANTLQKIIVFAKNHVSKCQLCLLKGFICEVCNNPKPIYPFDVDSTYHCEKCLAVYHATCMDANKFCPKCARRYKRQQLLESASTD
ncbi:pleckstrin homology domain-containing family M member 1-like [Uloborus diversus]|uniref:pleckstrin homology domain-containing family M member 1-like n=1 Tax=Uloborus diversus TaxID=327109 RepID=UPI00240A1D40|nr:pleckstrin homology domain-containing family M member 1-like [Uloborus diversus]